MTVIVTAIFSPLEGEKERLIAAFEATIPAVHAEAGCVFYAIHDAADGTITMIEKWESVADLDAHARGEATRNLNVAIAPYLAAPTIVTRMAPIPVGGAAGTL